MSRRNIKPWKGRQARPVEKELSSGAIVMIKRVSLSALMARGEIPQSFFEASSGKKPSEMTPKERQDMVAKTMELLKSDPRAMAEMTQLARVVAKDALDWPRVVERLSHEEGFSEDFPGREALAEAGITKRSDLDDISEEALAALPGVGKDVAAQIFDALGEITLDEIPIEDLFEIMNFALKDAPVQTASGEVPAESIHKTAEDEHVQGGGVDEPHVRAVA